MRFLPIAKDQFDLPAGRFSAQRIAVFQEYFVAHIDVVSGRTAIHMRRKEVEDLRPSLLLPLRSGGYRLPAFGDQQLRQRVRRHLGFVVVHVILLRPGHSGRQDQCRRDYITGFHPSRFNVQWPMEPAMMNVIITCNDYLLSCLLVYGLKLRKGTGL